jgi:hypothetical protein
MKEIWMDISGYEDFYQCSNFGRIKSLGRIILKSNGIKYTAKERILSPGLDSYGYLQVPLTNSNKERKTFLVHRLVCTAFLGASDMDINHKDGVKINNHVSNLQYCTKSENMLHAYKLGLKKICTFHGPDRRHPATKFTEENVKSMIEKAHNGTPLKSIAEEFETSSVYVKRIVQGRNWKYLQHLPKHEASHIESQTK